MNDEGLTKEKIYDTVHNEKTVLLQKNARCPECAGTLQRMTEGAFFVIRCIDCHTKYIPKSGGLNDNELICTIQGGRK